MKRYTTLFSIFLLLTLAACQDAQQESPSHDHNEHSHGSSQGDHPEETVAVPVNKKCPIMDGEVDLKGETATHKEHTIGFCCEGCKSDWEEWDSAKKDAFVASALKK